jgi:hypothetical protein
MAAFVVDVNRSDGPRSGTEMSSGRLYSNCLGCQPRNPIRLHDRRTVARDSHASIIGISYVEIDPISRGILGEG